MSGFSAEWLALREPADRRSVSPALTARVAAWARAHAAIARRPLTIVDLGSGTGSTLRRLAPILPADQHWRLIDNDSALLDRSGADIPANGGGPSVRVTTRCADLVRAPLGDLLDDADLVTASAVFDLVSLSWCRALAHALARPRRLFFAMLTYNGRMGWWPPDDDDETMRRLFNRHQGTDKGFGPALGPSAAAALADALSTAGAEIAIADSSWLLGSSDRALASEVLAGWADAAAAIEPGATTDVEAWRARRWRRLSDPDSRLVVGHVDVLALWP